MLGGLRKEFSSPENLKDAERGIALGLIVGTVFAALLTTSDYVALAADNVLGRNPYGIVWYWLNYGFWTDFPYRMSTMFFVLVFEGLMWYELVRTKRLNKFLFYAGWFQSIIWMRGSVFQNVTVTTFAPLISLTPWVIVLVLLQKLPIGWSWIPWNNQHWWCAFVGNNGFASGDYITFVNGQKLILCPGGWLRFDPAYSWFWSYAMIVFWIVMPFLFWLKPRWKAWRAKLCRKCKLPKEYCICGMTLMEGPCCEGGDLCHGECAECSKCGREFCKGKCEGHLCDDCSLCERDGCTFHE